MQGLQQLMEARSKLEKRVQSQKSAPRAEKRTRSQARCLGQRHRVPANRLGWLAEPTSGSSAVPSRPARPESKNAPGNRNGVQPPGAPKQKRTIAEPLHGKVDCSFCYFCGEMLVVRDGNDGHAALFGFG